MVLAGLLIPYARDGDRPVTPEHAVRGKTYACPLCLESVFLRSGQIRRRHFAHVGDSEHADSAGESALHLRAKLTLYNHLLGAIQGKAPPMLFVRRCSQCGREHEQPLPLANRRSSVATEFEFRCDPETRVRVDVALLDINGDLEVAFEVVVSHDVDDDKAKAFGHLPWMTLNAHQVLRTPDRIRPVKSGNVKPMRACPIQGRAAKQRSGFQRRQRAYPRPSVHTHWWILGDHGVRRCKTCGEQTAINPVASEEYDERADGGGFGGFAPPGFRGDLRDYCRRYGHLPFLSEQKCSRCGAVLPTIARSDAQE